MLMKIILTAHSISQGGTDRVCAHLANGFVKHGHDTEVVVFCQGGAGESAILPLIRDDVKITFLGRRSSSRMLDQMRALPRFVTYLKGAQPDSVLSTANGMNWITFLGYSLACLKQSRLVLKITNPVIRESDSSFVRALRNARYNLMYRSASAVLTLSDQDTSLLQHHFPRLAGRFRTVFNPYVTPELLALSPSPDAEKIVLAVGRLSPQKRFDLLIRAFAQIRTPARLIILGEGGSRETLTTLAQQVGVAGKVEMPGFVSDISPWLQRADIVALSSVYEGVPGIVLEAMALNCPVVATDCFPAAATLIGTAEGCLLVEADTGALARAIDECLGKPRPTTLRALAEPYGIESAVISCLDAMNR